MILTLKDSGVLDNGDDTLENVNIVEEEKVGLTNSTHKKWDFVYFLRNEKQFQLQFKLKFVNHNFVGVNICDKLVHTVPLCFSVCSRVEPFFVKNYSTCCTVGAEVGAVSEPMNVITPCGSHGNSFALRLPVMSP